MKQFVLAGDRQPVGRKGERVACWGRRKQRASRFAARCGQVLSRARRVLKSQRGGTADSSLNPDVRMVPEPLTRFYPIRGNSANRHSTRTIPP